MSEISSNRRFLTLTLIVAVAILGFIDALNDQTENMMSYIPVTT